MVEVRPGVLGYIVTPSEPTCEDQVKYMREWLVLKTVDARQVLPEASPGSKATFFVSQSIGLRQGRALLHVFFQCR